MFTKVSVLVVVIFFLSGPVLAINFSATLLTGYEPQDFCNVDVNIKDIQDPNLEVNWPLLGGVNGVPPATQGRYVAKLHWTDESDCNIQVGHYWKNFTFDFTDTKFLYVDVFVVGDSAMASSIGLYDQHWPYPFTWVGTDFEYLMRPGEWRTIPFYVGALDQNGLDHIEALVFNYLAETSGTIYLDNLRLSSAIGDCHCARRVVFSGYTWCVLQSTWVMDAGPNFYTADQNDIYIDSNGFLHLSIKYKDANAVSQPGWYCSGLVGARNTGYGTYVYTVDANTESLDPNIVVGLFVYDVCDPCGYREIDVELTKWGDSADINNAQYVVQPWNHTGNLFRFPICYSGPTNIVTHEIKWTPARVDFKSYYGDYSPNPSVPLMISSWSYTGPDIPQPAYYNPRINFYLTKGALPQNGQNAEITIKSFSYLPLGDLDSDGKVDFLDFALFSDKWLWDAR